MSASRPGNTDRGWNDPPMFFYKHENQAQQSPKKSALTQRVGMPQNYPSLAKKSTESAGKTKSLLPTASGPPPTGPPLSGPPPSGPPPSGPPPMRTSPSGPPPSGPPPSSAHPAASKPIIPCEVEPAKDAAQNIPEDLCETTLANLNLVLQSCQDKLQKRVLDDITKKLKILQDAWTKEKLSKQVQQRMGRLAVALVNQQYDEANEIHLSLMVDFVAEVSQWMVGIKRLIFEAKKHCPVLEIKESSDNKQQSEEEIRLSDGIKTLEVEEDTSKCEHTEKASEVGTEDETSPVKGEKTQTLEGHAASSDTAATNCEKGSVEEIVLSKGGETQSDVVDSSTEPSNANVDSSDSKASDAAEGSRSADHIGDAGKEE